MSGRNVADPAAKAYAQVRFTRLVFALEREASLCLVEHPYAGKHIYLLCERVQDGDSSYLMPLGEMYTSEPADTPDPNDSGDLDA
jgi:hypothetical protein